MGCAGVEEAFGVVGVLWEVEESFWCDRMSSWCAVNCTSVCSVSIILEKQLCRALPSRMPPDAQGYLNSTKSDKETVNDCLKQLFVRRR